MFAAAVELGRASAATPVSELAARVERRERGDEELVVDPALFHALGAQRSDVADVDVRLKPGRADNEMTRFRYDVVLHKAGEAPVPVADVRTLALEHWSADAGARRPRRRAGGAARHRAAQRPPRPGGRAGEAARRDHRLDRHGRRLADRARPQSPPGEHPDDLEGIDDRYTVTATWSAAGVDRFDVVLFEDRPASASPLRPSIRRFPWSAYANQPPVATRGRSRPSCAPTCARRCPTTWCPRAFVVLDALPRTPNGKIDRNALPAPDRARVEDAEALVAAEGDLEVTIATIWQDLLALDAVGVETNLFDLGANSLMMVRASSRLGAALGRKVSVGRVVRSPDSAQPRRPPRRTSTATAIASG